MIGKLALRPWTESAFPVSLMILYRHPRRPDEAGMTVVADQATAAAMKDQLELRGFRVIEIVTAPFPMVKPY
jgi:hypothetical protein